MSRKLRYGIWLLAGFASICLLFLILNNINGAEKNTRATVASEMSAPVHLRIPSIKVDAPIIPVGLTPTNTMGAPKGPSDTAWYELGPTPGEIGSAVIAGHRGWHIGPAVFDNLHKLKPGDKIYIQNKEGKELAFVVRDMRVYGAKDVVPEVWNKNDAAHLNLITCSGDFNVMTGTSNERLVVFTDLTA